MIGIHLNIYRGSSDNVTDSYEYDFPTLSMLAIMLQISVAFPLLSLHTPTTLLQPLALLGWELSIDGSELGFSAE